MKHVLTSNSKPQRGLLGPVPTDLFLWRGEFRYDRVLKRGVDLAFCLMVLPFFVPIVLLLAVVVRRDGGPVFFGHERVGRNGIPFKCLKIRSMVPDAKARLEALLEADPEAAVQWKAERKLDNDPRITPFGHFLRKSSLDELPQLLNILRGEMSLVGPRPVPQDELDENYGVQKRVYQAMRPGLTGLWQVSGRNDVSYAERVQMDVDYFKTMSLRRDLSILLRTALAVVKRTGK